MTNPKLIVVQLNELNFDIVREYVRLGHLPSFRALLESYREVSTFAESEYRNLEPWIQWVSAHTGRTFGEHQVFRLGDMANVEIPQIFEALEAAGLRVGALSPMNSVNRLKNPAYFVPDPWTQTASDDSGFSRRLTQMLRQTVNDNAQSRISAASLIVLFECLIRTLHPRRTLQLLRMAAASRRKPWCRALVLDSLVHMTHLHLVRSRRADVSFVFLNAGAHIQHHYFHSARAAGNTKSNPEWYVPSDADPVLDMLVAYDAVVADYLDLAKKGVRVVFATGLTQVPYDRVKFYYRLKDHAGFLQRLGVEFATVRPRMTRDFEIIFRDQSTRSTAMEVLKSARIQGNTTPVFGEIEDRPDGLFVTMSFPDEIRAGDVLETSAATIDRFGEDVAFVAIKNGMHSTRGFAFFSPDIPIEVPGQAVHVSSLFRLTLESVK